MFLLKSWKEKNLHLSGHILFLRANLGFSIYSGQSVAIGLFRFLYLQCHHRERESAFTAYPVVGRSAPLVQ